MAGPTKPVKQRMESVFDLEGIPLEPAPIIKCPKCGELEKIETRSNQWGLSRTCGTCGNSWAGGTMGVAQPDVSGTLPDPEMGFRPSDPEEDVPSVQFTGAPHRLAGDVEE